MTDDQAAVERAARAFTEHLAGRSFSDEEWTATRSQAEVEAMTAALAAACAGEVERTCRCAAGRYSHPGCDCEPAQRGDEAVDDGLTRVEVTTRHPERYVLHNSTTGSCWRIQDGQWVRGDADEIAVDRGWEAVVREELVARLMDTLAYYHCRSVNPKADDPIMGYHAMSEDQREFLRERQREAAEEVARMWLAARGDAPVRSVSADQVEAAVGAYTGAPFPSARARRQMIRALAALGIEMTP